MSEPQTDQRVRTTVMVDHEAWQLFLFLAHRADTNGGREVRRFVREYIDQELKRRPLPVPTRLPGQRDGAQVLDVAEAD